MVKDVENSTSNSCKEENDEDDEDGPKKTHTETTPATAMTSVVSVVGSWCRSVRDTIWVVHLVLNGGSVWICGSSSGCGAIRLG